MTLRWCLLFGGVVLQIAIGIGAPTGKLVYKRWIPPQMSDYDNGYDFQGASGGSSPDGSMSHNNNYMSYWSDYFPGASGDYSGMSFRNSDASSDPVQQLRNVQAYSYAQAYQPQYSQLRLPYYSYPQAVPYAPPADPTYAGRALATVSALSPNRFAQSPTTVMRMSPQQMIMLMTLVNQMNQLQPAQPDTQSANTATIAEASPNSGASIADINLVSEAVSAQAPQRPALLEIAALDRAADEKGVDTQEQAAESEVAEAEAAQPVEDAAEDAQAQETARNADAAAEGEAQQDVSDVGTADAAESEQAAETKASDTQDAAENEQGRSRVDAMDSVMMSEPAVMNEPALTSPLDQIYPGMMVPSAYKQPMYQYYQPPPGAGQQTSSSGQAASPSAGYPNYGMQYPNPYMNPYLANYYGYPTPPRVARTAASVPVMVKYIYGIPTFG